MSELTCFSSKVLFWILHSSNLQVTFREIAGNKFSISAMFLPIMLLSSHLLLWFLSATSLGKSYSLFSGVYCFCSYFFFLSIFRFLVFQWDCFLPLPWILNGFLHMGSYFCDSFAFPFLVPWILSSTLPYVSSSIFAGSGHRQSDNLGLGWS